MPPPGSVLMRGLLEVFMLQSLEGEPKHGYALLKEMEENFGEEPNRNKIYPLLAKLEEGGLIRGTPDEDSSRGRTTYELTEAGRDTLAAYRAMPVPYRLTVARIWGAGQVGGAPGAAARPVPVTGPRVAESAAAPPAGAPYPCPDARVHAEKHPVTGELSLRLTGCPIGTFDYCPLCPIHRAVEPFRRLMFG